MTLEELKALLGEGADDTIISTVSGLIETEKTKGITEYRKKDNEVLKYKNIIKDLGYDSDKFGSVDEFKNSLKETIQATPDNELKMRVLQEKITFLESQYNTEKDSRSLAERKAKHGTIRSKLVDTLGNKLYGINAHIDNILMKDELDILEDNIVSKDGRDFDSYISSFLESNKDDLKVEQIQGSSLNVKKTNRTPVETDLIAAARSKMPLFKGK